MKYHPGLTFFFTLHSFIHCHYIALQQQQGSSSSNTRSLAVKISSPSSSSRAPCFFFFLCGFSSLYLLSHTAPSNLGFHINLDFLFFHYGLQLFKKKITLLCFFLYPFIFLYHPYKLKINRFYIIYFDNYLICSKYPFTF